MSSDPTMVSQTQDCLEDDDNPSLTEQEQEAEVEDTGTSPTKPLKHSSRKRRSSCSASADKFTTTQRIRSVADEPSLDIKTISDNLGKSIEKGAISKAAAIKYAADRSYDAAKFVAASKKDEFLAPEAMLAAGTQAYLALLGQGMESSAAREESIKMVNGLMSSSKSFGKCRRQGLAHVSGITVKY